MRALSQHDARFAEHPGAEAVPARDLAHHAAPRRCLDLLEVRNLMQIGIERLIRGKNAFEPVSGQHLLEVVAIVVSEAVEHGEKIANQAGSAACLTRNAVRRVDAALARVSVEARKFVGSGAQICSNGHHWGPLLHGAYQRP